MKFIFVTNDRNDLEYAIMIDHISHVRNSSPTSQFTNGSIIYFGTSNTHESPESVSAILQKIYEAENDLQDPALLMTSSIALEREYGKMLHETRKKENGKLSTGPSKCF